MRRFCKRSASPVLALAALVLILFGRVAGDSLNIRLAGEWPFSGLTSVIGVASRNLAFVGSGGGVYVLDISRPDTPQVLSMKIQTLGTVNDLFYEPSTQRLYVAGQQGGLSIWDVSSATNPQRLGVCRTPSQAYRVVVSGGYAYIADRDSGLRIVNVANPANPYQAGRYDTPGDARDVAVSGSFAYVGDGGYLRVINVSDSANPYQVGVCDSLVTLGIAQSDSFVYVVNGYSGLIIVSVADPTHPYRMGRCPPMSYADDVALRSHYAYVADNMFGWLVMDISDPWNPRRTGAMGGGGRFWVTVSDTLAFFIGDDVDINNAAVPTNPYEVGSYSPPGLSGSCAVSGQYAYLGTSQGLLVLNISDPQSIFEVGSCPAGATDIVIRGQYAYAPCSGGFGVIDVSNPTNPVRVGFCLLGDPSVRVALAGTVACVACQNSVRLVDVSDPTQPVVVGVYDSLMPATGIVVRDSYAYVSETWEGLRILDITDPAQPVLVGHLPTPLYAHGLSLIWPYAFVACGDAGLSVVDVSNPASPVSVGQYVSGNSIVCVATQGRYIYVTGYYAPLQILDASDPTAPVSVAWYDDAGQNPVPVGGYVLVGSTGLHVYEQIGYGIEEGKVRDVRDDSPRLLCCRLSGGSLGISFVLPRETRVGFRLYDLAGREMTQSPSLRYDRGKHLVVLAIEHLAPGVYFVKSSPSMTGAGKVVVCK